MQAEVFGVHIVAAGRCVVGIIVSHDGSLAHFSRQVIANQCDNLSNNEIICYKIREHLLYIVQYGLR